MCCAVCCVGSVLRCYRALANPRAAIGHPARRLILLPAFPASQRSRRRAYTHLGAVQTTLEMRAEQDAGVAVVVPAKGAPQTPHIQRLVPPIVADFRFGICLLVRDGSPHERGVFTFSAGGILNRVFTDARERGTLEVAEIGGR